jgi:hypothetical protein
MVPWMSHPLLLKKTQLVVLVLLLVMDRRSGLVPPVVMPAQPSTAVVKDEVVTGERHRLPLVLLGH